MIKPTVILFNLILDYKTCVTNKHSDQLVHPANIARVFFYLSMDSPEAVEGTCDQRKR